MDFVVEAGRVFLHSTLSLWVLEVCRVLQLHHESRVALSAFHDMRGRTSERGRVPPLPTALARGVQHEKDVQLHNPVSRSPTQPPTGHKEGQKGCEERYHEAWVEKKDRDMQSYYPQLLAQVGTPDGGSASESARCDVHDAEAVSVQKSLGSSSGCLLEMSLCFRHPRAPLV